MDGWFVFIQFSNRQSVNKNLYHHRDKSWINTSKTSHHQQRHDKKGWGVVKGLNFILFGICIPDPKPDHNHMKNILMGWRIEIFLDFEK